MGKVNKSFASDNWSGVCPEIMEALIQANIGHVESYGETNDFYTQRAIARFREHFGLRSYQAVVSAESAHLNEDECAAPEKFGGTKILGIKTENGKILPEQVAPFLHSIGFQHHAQPRIISISEVTEKGTIYSPDEIRELATFAHSHDMLLHVDGARISNAAASLGVTFRELITDTGVDILSFGGTKNGLMFGEAVVFLKKDLARDFQYLRKQGLQLHSKMRFISAQFDRYLTDDLWKKNAENANRMAKLLESSLKHFSQIKITQPVATKTLLFPYLG